MVGIASVQTKQEEWNAPTKARIIGFLDALPSIRRATILAARRLWDSGISSEMRQGSYDAIETLERAWLQLAKFYPPSHFSNMSADHFFSEFIGDRFKWHRQLFEPNGPESSGTIIRELTSGAVLDDVAKAIADTVEGIYVGYSLLDFDLRKWRDEWESAGRQGDADGDDFALKIITGSGGAFEERRANGLYKTRHTFSIAIKNADPSRFLSNCKLFVDIPDQGGGAPKSHLLVNTFTLNGSEERFVQLVSYDEPATVSGHADDFISLLIPIGVGYGVGYGWPWRLPIGSYLITLRAITKETGPCEVVCKFWVDEHAKLHFEAA